MRLWPYPAETLLEVVWLAVIVMTVLVLVAALFTIAHRTWVLRREQRRAARLARYTEQADLMSLGELGVASFLRGLRRSDWRSVERYLLELSTKFTGDVRGNLEQAFSGLGAVPRALRDIESRRWWRRASAAHRLGLMGDTSRRVSHALRTLLHDPHPEVQVAAARALVELRGEQFLPDIVATLARVETYSVLRMADIIMRGGQAAVPALVTFLSQPAPPRAHAVALEQLGALRALAAEQAIISQLASPHVDVRAATCRALGRLDSPAAVEALLGALRDPAWPVRGQAARALGEIGDPVAVEHLEPLLQEEHWWVVYNTGRSLVQLGARAAVESHLLPETRDQRTAILREVLSLAVKEAKW